VYSLISLFHLAKVSYGWPERKEQETLILRNTPGATAIRARLIPVAAIPVAVILAVVILFAVATRAAATPVAAIPAVVIRTAVSSVTRCVVKCVGNAARQETCTETATGMNGAAVMGSAVRYSAIDKRAGPVRESNRGGLL
jgi:hypothetical protein